ncbi:MAG TPA: hypothetical protein VFF43_08430 [Caldimonas sp.]|nr:hypothetical protein [Caldimonas sp.]
MAGETRDLKVRWLGDATSLERSARRAATAVSDSGKKIGDAGSTLGSTFGKLGSLLGTFHLPFAKAASTVESDLGAMGTAGVGFGDSMAGPVAAGLAAGGAAALAFGKQSVDAAENFNKAHERLAVVVKNTGAAVSGWGDQVKAADDKMSALGFNEADTESSLAKLVPVTHNVGEATKLMGLAADVARARGETLDESTGRLVAIEAGRMRGLAQLGIAQKDATGKTIDAKTAIQKITDLYGGAASQYADTYAGKLATLKAETNRLQVAIGNDLLPVLDTAASAMVPVAENWTSAFTKISSGLETASSHAHTFGLGIGDIVGAVAKATPGLNIAGTALGLFGEKGKKAKDATQQLADAQKQYAKDLEAGTQNTQQGVKDRQALTDASAKAKTITDGLSAATSGETDATAAQTAAQHKAIEAAQERAKVEKTETDAIIGTHDATIALDNATLGVSDSIDTYNAKALEAAKDGGRNATANRDWEKASNDVKSAIDNVATSAEQQAVQQANLHGKTLSARDAADAQRLALARLRDNIAPGTPFRSYLDQLIAQLDNAARPRTETLALQVIGSTPQGSITWNPATGTFFAPGAQGPPVIRRQEGGYIPGPIGAPVPAIVHGGEYVVRAQDVGKGGGGVNQYSITVNVAPGADPAAAGKAVVDAIRAYERRNGSSWRAA